jgi:flagellar biosynthesis/type III secretory pathway protein FliH
MRAHSKVLMMVPRKAPKKGPRRVHLTGMSSESHLVLMRAQKKALMRAHSMVLMTVPMKAVKKEPRRVHLMGI